MPRTITRYFDGLLWVDPSASKDEVANAVLPPGPDASATSFPCRVVTERRRLRDCMTGRRQTRDWRVGHFLIWGADLGREETRTILTDARRIGLDEIVVYGQRAFLSGPSIDFRQFGVRDLTSLPGEG